MPRPRALSPSSLQATAPKSSSTRQTPAVSRSSSRRAKRSYLAVAREVARRRTQTPPPEPWRAAARVSLIDFAYQRFQQEKDLKMSKQEVKEEHKNTEGDPHSRAAFGRSNGRWRRGG